MPFSPVALFVYNRPEILIKVLDHLKRNPEMAQTKLYVFSDGPSCFEDIDKVKEVLAIVRSIDWCKELVVIHTDTNKGLARSIIEGVTHVLKEHDTIIVLEDDLLVGNGFLKYMNSTLDQYRDSEDVISICGYVYPVKEKLPDTFFIKAADCLGWATWKRGWSLFDRDAKKLYQTILDKDLSFEFDYEGNYPYTELLRAQLDKKVYSWAVLWHASAFVNNKLTLFPRSSLVEHIGISGTNYGSDPFLNKVNFTNTVRVKPLPIIENKESRKAFATFFAERKKYYESNPAPAPVSSSRTINPFSMFNKLYQKYFVRPVSVIVKTELTNQEVRLRHAFDEIKLQNGRVLANQVLSIGAIRNIHDAEFKVFSQWGDDGIIQYLIHRTGTPYKTFIEFGVQDYTESNTRFLLMNNNWSGLILDSGKEYMQHVKRDSIYWRQELTAVCAFITVDNVNELFTDNKFSGKLGLLSIDIDGNDYWVWEKITVVDPDIVIVEYNSVFGSKHAITVPYNPSFLRGDAHSSNLYWGCSLKALCSLAVSKGYIFVGCNSNGNNAYFVKKEKANGLKALTPEEGYVESKFRESRDRNGALSYINGPDRIKIIGDMPVMDVENNKMILIKDLS